LSLEEAIAKLREVNPGVELVAHLAPDVVLPELARLGVLEFRGDPDVPPGEALILTRPESERRKTEMRVNATRGLA